MSSLFNGVRALSTRLRSPPLPPTKPEMPKAQTANFPADDGEDSKSEDSGFEGKAEEQDPTQKKTLGPSATALMKISGKMLMFRTSTTATPKQIQQQQKQDLLNEVDEELDLPPPVPPVVPAKAKNSRLSATISKLFAPLNSAPSGNVNLSGKEIGFVSDDSVPSSVKLQSQGVSRGIRVGSSTSSNLNLPNVSSKPRIASSSNLNSPNNLVAHASVGSLSINSGNGQTTASAPAPIRVESQKRKLSHDVEAQLNRKSEEFTVPKTSEPKVPASKSTEPQKKTQQETKTEENNPSGCISCVCFVIILLGAGVVLILGYFLEFIFPKEDESLNLSFPFLLETEELVIFEVLDAGVGVSNTTLVGDSNTTSDLVATFQLRGDSDESFVKALLACKSQAPLTCLTAIFSDGSAKVAGNICGDCSENELTLLQLGANDLLEEVKGTLEVDAEENLEIISIQVNSNTTFGNSSSASVLTFESANLEAGKKLKSVFGIVTVDAGSVQALGLVVEE